MGLIPQNFIEELLSRIDIVDVINARVPLKKAGRNYMACCPFHQEKTPSFSVVPDKQFFNCFGCGAAGSALKFVMTFDNLDFKEAIYKLANDAGIDVPEEQGKASDSNSNYKIFFNILEKTSELYHTNLRKSPQAKNYLEQRGLDQNIIDYFKVGFAENSWDLLSRYFKNNKLNTPVEKVLEQVGLWITKTDANDKPTGGGYDRFRNRIMFPIRDVKGRVIAFGGRVLDDSKPKYLNSPETKLFHKSAELYGLYETITLNHNNKTKINKVVIVEGYLDVISLFQHGINYAVATLGTATSYRHLAKLFKYCPEIIYCFDGDEAGQKAAWRALENSLPALYPGRVIKFLFLPENHDPDSYVRQYGRANFEQSLTEAVLLTDYLFIHQLKQLANDYNQHDLSTVESKVNYIKLCKPLINKVPDGDFKVILENELASKCQLSLDAVNRIFSDGSYASKEAPLSKSINEQVQTQNVSYGDSNQQLSLWRHASILLLHNPEFCKLVSAEMIVKLTEIQQNKGAKFFIFLYNGLFNQDSKTNISIPELIDKLSNDIANKEQSKKVIGYIMKLLSADPIVSGEEAKQEFLDLLDKINLEFTHLQMQYIERKVKEQGISSLSKSEKEMLQSLLFSK